MGSPAGKGGGKQQRSKGRLSLFGVNPEDALRRALSTPPPKPQKKAKAVKKKG